MQSVRDPRRPSHNSHTQGSLFERLQADDIDEALVDEGELGNRVRSIKRNIRDILNARLGGSLSSPNFGLDDLNDASVGSTDMLRKITREVVRTIELHEPRVSDVRASFDRAQNKSTELVFVVSARTEINRRSEQLTIDIMLADQNTFKLL